jgi:hypothetical protein
VGGRQGRVRLLGGEPGRRAVLQRGRPRPLGTAAARPQPKALQPQPQLAPAAASAAEQRRRARRARPHLAALALRDELGERRGAVDCDHHAAPRRGEAQDLIQLLVEQRVELVVGGGWAGGRGRGAGGAGARVGACARRRLGRARRADGGRGGLGRAAASSASKRSWARGAGRCGAHAPPRPRAASRRSCRRATAPARTPPQHGVQHAVEVDVHVVHDDGVERHVRVAVLLGEPQAEARDPHRGRWRAARRAPRCAAPPPLPTRPAALRSGAGAATGGLEHASGRATRGAWGPRGAGLSGRCAPDLPGPRVGFGRVTKRLEV